MKKQLAISVITVLLVLTGVIMLYLGFTSAQKILWPPVISGTGFMLAACGFWVNRK